MSKSLFAVVILMAITVHFVSAQKNVIGYFGSWSNYRLGDGNFKVENIDPFLYTHIIYSFFGINSDGTISSLDSWLDNDLNAVKRCVNLKTINPKLKVMAAIGGWNAGSKVFSDVAANPDLRKKFADAAVEFCEKNHFDGLDMDWEYPGQRDGNPVVDKTNFVLLMKELSTRFKQKNLILSAAVAAPAASASVSYDIKQLADYVDFINLMAYDFHASWDGSTGQNAPLSAASSTDKLNVMDSVKYWLDQGLPANKLNLGMATYGRTFTLIDNNQNGRGARTSGPGQPGPYTREAGMLGYNEICEMKKDSKWKEVWDNTQSVPYITNGNQWVGFDNVKSIQAKCNFIKSSKLAGGMFWSIETDDFLGKCGTKFELANTLKKCLG